MKIYIQFLLPILLFLMPFESTVAKTKKSAPNISPFQWTKTASAHEPLSVAHNCRIIVKTLHSNKRESFEIYRLNVKNRSSCEKSSSLYKKIYSTTVLKKEVRFLWFG